MANGRSGRKKSGSGRVGGGFVALPHDVLDSPAYMRLSYPARALLIDVARQFDGKNNGRQLISKAAMAKRGWSSNDVLQRAKAELLATGFIFETVKGQRPNKASWYACTWWVLDRLDGFDDYAHAAFQKAAYRSNENTSLSPSPGPAKPAIGPAGGPEGPPLGPGGGPMQAKRGVPAGPGDGPLIDLCHLPAAGAGTPSPPPPQPDHPPTKTLADVPPWEDLPPHLVAEAAAISGAST